MFEFNFGRGDDSKVSQCGLKAGDTIHMVLQLRGGNWTENMWFKIPEICKL